MNQQVWRWFDNGKACDALIGDGDYFLRDYTWGSHDRLLVLNQLLDWAAANDRSAASAEALTAAVELLASTERTDDAFRLVHCYFIASDDRHQTLPLDLNRLVHVLAQLARRHAVILSRDAQQRSLVLLVAARLPQLANVLDLHFPATSDANVA